jgi:hypothetical protein
MPITQHQIEKYNIRMCTEHANVAERDDDDERMMDGPQQS